MVAEPGKHDVPEREDDTTAVEPLETDDDLEVTDAVEGGDIDAPLDPQPDAAHEPEPRVPATLRAETVPADESPPPNLLDDRRRTPVANAVDPDDVRLGVLLRESRRRRALTLADVHRDIRINPDYLEALEDERWGDLPAPVYARGFLRSYARYLGLDADAVLKMMPADLPKPPGLQPSAGLRRSAGKTLPPLPSLSRMGGTGSGGLVGVMRANPRLLGALLGVVALGVLAFFLAPDLLGGGDGGAEVDPAASATLATGTQGGATSAATEAPVLATVPPFQPGETPSFIGVSRETAEDTLGDLGLSYVVIEAATDEAPAGVVFGQSPQPGETLEANADVTLIVSQGAP